MQPPMIPKQVRFFLGLMGYYRNFIKGFAKIAKPLTYSPDSKSNYHWTLEHQTAFVNIKEAIVQAPILNYPNPEKKYIIYTDASDDTCEHNCHKNTMVQNSQ